LIVVPSGASISRSVADTTPSVSERSRPNGLPIAIAVSPTRTLFESPRGSGSKSAVLGSMRSSARSVPGSRPTMRASIRLPSSPKRTDTFEPPSATCSLVTIDPLSSMTKPVPVATSSSSRGGPDGIRTPGARASTRTIPRWARWKTERSDGAAAALAGAAAVPPSLSSPSPTPVARNTTATTTAETRPATIAVTAVRMAPTYGAGRQVRITPAR
jgi:hypothetical protein